MRKLAKRLRALGVWVLGVVLVAASAIPVLAGNNSGQAFTTWPDTGQTKCYSNTTEIPCPAAGQPFHGQDAQYQGPTRSYTNQGDGTIKDNVTGLVWEQKTNMDGVTNYTAPHDADNTYTWCDRNSDTNGGNLGTCGDHDTQDFIDQLNSSNFGGHSDWRLPTINELETLADKSGHNPAIDPVFAAATQPSDYWSSTTFAGNSNVAWAPHFYGGGGGFGGKGGDYYARAVRGGGAQAANHFTDNGDGTVTDTVTCLQWQKRTMDTDNDGNPDALIWQQALAAAEGLSLAGKTDWRLPDISELRSLVDCSRYDPAIDSVFAATTVPSDYWSSTNVEGLNNYAWLAHFYFGYDDIAVKLKSYYARAVRGGQCGNFGSWTPSGARGRISNIPRSGLPGTTFTQSGTGFTPNSTVTLHFKNHLGQEQTPIQKNTNASGAFSLTYTAPFDKPFGTHSWWAVDDATRDPSEPIRYEITTNSSTQTNIGNGTVTTLPGIHLDLPYGTLSSRGVFHTDRETFVIIHGWNTSDTTDLPEWMTRMGAKIEQQGGNVLYWNWQEKAKTEDERTLTEFLLDSTNDPSCTVLWGRVPAGETDNSGKYLALALKKALSPAYVASGKTIHLLGHSLGSFVAAHTVEYATNMKLTYAGNIKHLVFFDSPCVGGMPAEDFIHKHRGDLFIENYISQVGNDFADADVEVWLHPKANLLHNILDGHGYSHDWYESSVTNFTDGLLSSQKPSSTMPWGYYWRQESNRAGIQTDYTVINPGPHYQLYGGRLYDLGVDFAGQVIVDYTGLVGKASVEMVEQWTDWAKAVGKVIKIVGIKTFNVASDAAEAVVDVAGHATVNVTNGFVNLVHSSTAVLDIPVTIPAEANALSFGTQFVYCDPGSQLEVFVNGEPVYQTTSDQVMASGLRMVPWIGVKRYAGQTISLSLRLSNPNANTAGKIKIDDLVLASIEDPKVTTGDYNNDGLINLADVILALQVVSGQTPSNRLYRQAAVDAGRRIDMEEAIFALRKAAGQ